MNIKKSFLVALAGATAFATMSSFAVSAATPGYSDGAVEEQAASEQVTVTEGEATTGTVELESADITVDFEIPADAVEADSALIFNVAAVTDLGVIDLVDSIDEIKDFKTLDLFFTDENGDIVDMVGKNVVVTIKATGYNTVYYFNGRSFEDMGAEVGEGTLTFTAPHFSTYVLANVETETDEPSNEESSNDDATVTPGTSTDSNNNGSNGGTTQTGDNGFVTTIVIFSIMAVISLATAVVATKAKKSSK